MVCVVEGGRGERESWLATRLASEGAPSHPVRPPTTPPPLPRTGYSCQQQKDWGKCGSDWMNAGGYCRHTCGQCCWGGKRRALLQAETDTVPASGDAAPEGVTWVHTGRGLLQAADEVEAAPASGDTAPEGVTWVHARGLRSIDEAETAADESAAEAESAADADTDADADAPTTTTAAPYSGFVHTAGRKLLQGCDDKGTPDGFSCQQQKDWGKCGQGWMNAGGYCRHTCGQCCWGGKRRALLQAEAEAAAAVAAEAAAGPQAAEPAAAVAQASPMGPAVADVPPQAAAATAAAATAAAPAAAPRPTTVAAPVGTGTPAVPTSESSDLFATAEPNRGFAGGVRAGLAELAAGRAGPHIAEDAQVAAAQVARLLPHLP